MPPREARPKEWIKCYSGPNAEVWMHVRCIQELGELGASRAKIEACMDKMYCQMERSELIPTSKLNRNEGRHGPSRMRVQAFKSKAGKGKVAGRVYGVEGSILGKRTFFAALAMAKKKQKADPDDLARTADRVASVCACIAGAKV